MGDSKRFECMASLIATQFPSFRDRKLADVAGGKGHLNHALKARGFRYVVTLDKRHNSGKSIRSATFRWDYKERFDLVVGMHPDEATDHIILYAVTRNIPFVVCPCCAKPSAMQDKNFSKLVLGGKVHWPYKSWVNRLKQLAENSHCVTELSLPITGPNTVIIGRPK